MARLLTDKHFPRGITEELRKLGHDVLPAQEAQPPRTLDTDLLKFAIQQNRITVSNDKGFEKKHPQQVPNHKGIIHCTEDKNYAVVAHRIHQTIEAFPDLAGKVVLVRKPAQPDKSFEPRLFEQKPLLSQFLELTSKLERVSSVNPSQSLQKAHEIREPEQKPKGKTKGLDYE